MNASDSAALALACVLCANFGGAGDLARTYVSLLTLTLRSGYRMRLSPRVMD